MKGLGVCGAIILAAGESKRLGQPKQLVEYKGKTLIGNTIDAISEVVQGPIVVVVGANSERIIHMIGQMSSSDSITVVNNMQWESGMGGSLRIGLEAIRAQESSLSGVLVSVCDQPYLCSKVIRELITRAVEYPGSLIVANYGENYGPPVVFPSELFGSLARIPEDRGAKYLIKQNAKLVKEVAFSKGALDIDIPVDLDSLQ